MRDERDEQISMQGKVRRAEFNRRYNEMLNFMPEEKINLLKDYFMAFANFYYIFPLKKAFEIINERSEEKFSKAAFLMFAEAAPFCDELHCDVFSEDPSKDDETPTFDKNIVHASLLFDKNDYELLLNAKNSRKNCYIPPKEELLKYRDEYYTPTPPQYNAMVDFIAKYADVSVDEAVDEAYELLFKIIFGSSAPIEAVEYMCKFKNRTYYIEHYSEFSPLYTDLFNHTRSPFLNGYTPAEYLQMTNDPTESMYAEKENLTEEELAAMLKNVSEKAESYRQTIEMLRHNFHRLSKLKQRSEKTAKVGRNDPCPCGSGKKYKKCCGA